MSSTAYPPGPLYGLKYRNLVYVRNLKCASSFFSDNLVNTFKWEPIEYQTIDWNSDHVFGHLLDPIVRWRKGLAEWIVQCGLGEQFVSDSRLQKLLSSAPVLDLHTLPYTCRFKNHYHKIDWIPLIGTHNDSISYTTRLFKYYNVHIDIDLLDYSLSHYGTPLQRDIENVLVTIWNDGLYDFAEHLQAHKGKFVPNKSNTITENVLPILAPDIALYNEVVGKFNPHALSWDQMSWLR